MDETNGNLVSQRRTGTLLLHDGGEGWLLKFMRGIGRRGSTRESWLKLLGLQILGTWTLEGLAGIASELKIVPTLLGELNHQAESPIVGTFSTRRFQREFEHSAQCTGGPESVLSN
ncbi:hypothetical protein PABG_11236 [Paracoccidioides brasiliensis Pb03]|nr:hypothetical protein PABG_11236 [Paracoccidioides brasiliensis Pb03]